MSRYKHLDNNESEFPNVGNVNVYQYDNSLDYARFDHSQMHLQVCTVPWDMGEAHIGARTISGIGNVVYFETAEKRDAWFAAIPDADCFRFDTKYRNLHRTNGSTGEIVVPLPFDVAVSYNYVAVEYEMLAHDGDPLMYETAMGKRRWFWFIREVEAIAPNATKLHLMLDAWQTFIYSVNVSGMILERGHAPLIETDAKTYLENPLQHCTNLLAEDVSLGEAGITTATHEHVFNSGTMYAVIVCNSNAQTRSWGTKAANSWKTPMRRTFSEQGVTGYLAFALPENDLASFLNDVDSQVPQFKQTVSGVFFASENLITLSDAFTFAGHACNRLGSTYTSATVCNLDVSDFGYDDEYANLAKLYTYPYSYIRMTDENGDGFDLHIEDTDGTVKIDKCMSLVYPWINVTAQMSSAGKAVRRAISYRNQANRTMPIQGNWHETLMQWDVPVLGVFQDAGTSNDYGTHFDRAQQATAASNSYSNEIASAAASRDDQNANAECSVDNANLQVALNNANLAAGNAKANADLATNNAQNYTNTTAALSMSIASANNEIELETAQAAIGATSAVASGVIGAAASMASGPAGVAGAAASLANGIVGAATAQASASAGINFTSAGVSANSAYNTATYDAALSAASGLTAHGVTCENARTSAANSYTSGSTANIAATQRGNASRDYNAASANASRNLATANSAISNQVKQAALGVPETFGNFENGDTMATRPMGVFANVITQNPHAIAAAGDEFLRYGYMLGRQWKFDGNWNLAPKFTYWKLTDFWVTGLNVPDMYMDMIRFFLYGGVTVWRNPADIGNVSIYENV